MARRPPFRPYARLGVLAVVLVAMYAGMAGSGHLTPSLGLDLRGGTQVILTPQKSHGVSASKGQLNTAVSIIRQRVNGLGVSNANVVTQGSNVVISVPGKGRSDVLNQVGQTASLSFRETWTDPSGQVVNPANNPPAAAPTTSAPTTPVPTTSGSPPASSSPPAKASSSAAATSSTTAHPRVLSDAVAGRGQATPTPTTPASAATTPTTRATGSPTGAPTTTPPAATPTSGASPTAVPAGSYLAKQTAAETRCVESLPAGAQEQPQTAPAACTIATFQTLDCAQNGGRPLRVDEDDKHFVIACDRSGEAKYLLMPSDLTGTSVSSATATIGQTSQGASTGLWEVDVTFKDSAVSKVTQVSTKLFNNQQQPLAITLDGVVESNPSTNGVLGKNIQISGGTPPFSEKDANNLANALKYGSLPVAFARSSVETISASLGKSSLHGGLLAGGIGLLLVVLFVFLYYRMLGLATVASLATSALLVYASVVLLGQAIGYTLTLAGIAGLIVAIGITADSFVVFFERLKDEIREGRSPRLAVEYGWTRAWRTIFTADVVSILAALVLYIVSVGDVKGFAFTLGLSTALDIVVVQLFTRPLIALLMRFPIFSTSRASGLHPGVDLPRPASRTPREA